MVIMEVTVTDYIISFLTAKQIRKFLKFNKRPNNPPNSIFFQHRPLLRECYYLLFFVIAYLKILIPWPQCIVFIENVKPFFKVFFCWLKFHFSEASRWWSFPLILQYFLTASWYFDVFSFSWKDKSCQRILLYLYSLTPPKVPFILSLWSTRKTPFSKMYW